MIIYPTNLHGVLRLEPQVFSDDRGFFVEAWNKRAFEEAVGRSVEFVQDNRIRAVKDSLRGLHYQIAPMEQGKLLTVLQGTIYDVALDLRPDSPTYGQWVGEVLTGDEPAALWVPEGLAHGFLVLSKTVDVIYKTTNYYSPEHERSVRWDNKKFAIEWPLNGRTPILSEKDRR